MDREEKKKRVEKKSDELRPQKGKKTDSKSDSDSEYDSNDQRSQRTRSKKRSSGTSHRDSYFRKYFPHYDSRKWEDVRIFIAPTHDVTLRHVDSGISLSLSLSIHFSHFLLDEAKRRVQHLSDTLTHLGRNTPSKGDLRVQYYSGTSLSLSLSLSLS